MRGRQGALGLVWAPAPLSPRQSLVPGKTRWPSQPVRSGAQMGGSRLKSQGRISPSPLLSTPVQIPGRHPGGREWDERDEAGGDPRWARRTQPANGLRPDLPAGGGAGHS
ncbi:hypothetical protein CLOM_g17065 [Closterium sp. NIES-68]|nr:hypothetical protein CLOM_g17065 [Closterium sp. NIES-68]